MSRSNSLRKKRSIESAGQNCVHIRLGLTSRASVSRYWEFRKYLEGNIPENPPLNTGILPKSGILTREIFRKPLLPISNPKNVAAAVNYNHQDLFQKTLFPEDIPPIPRTTSASLRKEVLQENSLPYPSLLRHDPSKIAAIRLCLLRHTLNLCPFTS